MTTGARKELLAAGAAEGQRLDLYVGEALGLSRAQVKELFEGDAVRVNDRRAKKGDRVHAGARVSVVLPEVPEGAIARDEGFELPLLHLDEDVVVVDKPAGRPSHPLRPGEQGAVANALITRFPECEAASEDPREGGLCHRLDIETSGALVAARSRPIWDAMRAAFTTRDVDKHYWALVTGPLADEGDIDLPLRHHPRHPDRVETDVLQGTGAREAVSHFEVLGRAGEYSLVEVQIFTGVLHQVRAHLAAIGAPLVGDALYGGREEPTLSRFFLHARSLGFAHPRTRARVEVTSPLPPELVATLAVHGLALPSSAA